MGSREPASVHGAEFCSSVDVAGNGCGLQDVWLRTIDKPPHSHHRIHTSNDRFRGEGSGDDAMTIKVELGAEIVSRTFHTKQRQSPAMTDETNAQDLKALELEHLGPSKPPWTRSPERSPR